MKQILFAWDFIPMKVDAKALSRADISTFTRTSPTSPIGLMAIEGLISNALISISGAAISEIALA